jgi:hypothetical protein
MGDKLLDLLQESSLLQALITFGLLVSLLYLYLTGKPVPQELVNAFSVVLGFYFGAKVQNAVNKIERGGQS